MCNNAHEYSVLLLKQSSKTQNIGWLQDETYKYYRRRQDKTYSKFNRKYEITVISTKNIVENKIKISGNLSVLRLQQSSKTTYKFYCRKQDKT